MREQTAVTTIGTLSWKVFTINPQRNPEPFSRRSWPSHLPLGLVDPRSFCLWICLFWAFRITGII